MNSAENFGINYIEIFEYETDVLSRIFDKHYPGFEEEFKLDINEKPKKCLIELLKHNDRKLWDILKDYDKYRKSKEKLLKKLEIEKEKLIRKIIKK